MNRAQRALLIVATASAFAATAQQPQVVDAKGAVDVTTITAKIEAIDLANRVVTVKGPLGRVVALKVDDRVKNLAQVRAGDEIVLKYAESVAVALVQGGGGRSETVTTPAPVGAKPGIAMAQQTRIVAKIESVDPKRQMALLEGTNGRYVEVKVKDAGVFGKLEAGESVDVTYTEAVVIDVVRPKK